MAQAKVVNNKAILNFIVRFIVYPLIILKVSDGPVTYLFLGLLKIDRNAPITWVIFYGLIGCAIFVQLKPGLLRQKLHIAELIQQETPPRVMQQALPAPSTDCLANSYISQSPTYRDDSEVWNDINRMIGLRPVKEALRDIKTQVIADEMRRAQGRNVSPGMLHMIFRGNPGTGKTEIARKVGELFCALGILPGKAFVEARKSDLIGEYVGHTSVKTQAAIDKVLSQGGGVLFIDEAYGLGSRSGETASGGDFNADAVEILIQAMENNRDRLCVIMAGYPDLMNKFVATANPGLKSRIAFYVDFPDYSPQEIYQIIELQARQGYYIITNDAKEKILHYLYSINIGSEGNGRYARNIFESAVRKQSYRVVNRQDSQYLIGEDFAI